VPLPYDESAATAELAATVQRLFNQIQQYQKCLEKEFQAVYEEWIQAQHSLAVLNHRHPKNDD